MARTGIGAAAGGVVAGGVLAGVLAAAATAHAATAAQLEEAAVTTHASQGEVVPVEGATARLVRSAEGIFASLDTQGLPPGHAVTLLLAIVNDPAACEGIPCGPPDVVGRTAEVQADIVGAADGVVVAEDGRARFATFQPAGDLDQSWFGNGLQTPEGAEIHLVVNDHGPLLPDRAAGMVGSYRGGCSDDSVPAAFPDAARADGDAGPNTCRMLQVAIFAPAGVSQVGASPSRP